jgi:hypothetical protein
VTFYESIKLDGQKRFRLKRNRVYTLEKLGELCELDEVLDFSDGSIY